MAVLPFPPQPSNGLTRQRVITGGLCAVNERCGRQWDPQYIKPIKSVVI